VQKRRQLALHSEVARASVSRAFDDAAAKYDRDAEKNPVMVWLRRESLGRLGRAFRAGDFVLEVGCGTGEEALALARRGVRVMATDASAGMAEVVREKLTSASDVTGQVRVEVLRAEELGKLAVRYGTNAFDGAYSSLGPLNCVPDLSGVARDLAALVRPGGRVVASLLGKYCLWEILWYLAARKPRVAFRRWKGQASGTALPGGPSLEVYYWPVREIEMAFRPYFAIRATRALPWALPPTYVGAFMARHPRLFRTLEKIERRMAGVWPFNALGDHVHLEMVRLSPDLIESE
jgi:SAM-dependent methyltransferase